MSLTRFRWVCRKIWISPLKKALPWFVSVRQFSARDAMLSPRSLLPDKGTVFFVPLLLSLDNVRSENDAIHGTYFHALRLFVMAYALSTEARVYHVVLFALRNGIIGALRLAHVAIATFISDD